MSSGFVDKARISVKAGNGGNGAVAFHREKYVASGGPDGGDGGKGGSIVFTVDSNMSTLMDFRYKRKYIAENGLEGQGKRCYGRDGNDLYIKVPRGTVIRDFETGKIMHDMSTGEDWVCCKGGRGGWGNSHFATPTRQTPRFAKPGLPGESHELVLELKLIADVGLIGFPNVGKSTFLSVVSKAHPKVANYHFTTLFPNLGVVYGGDSESFVMADIPGIIEGAAEGAGLGYDFLRHIDRCRLLVHIVDVSGSEGRDPVQDFFIINNELKKYSNTLSERKQIVIANKTDLLEPDSNNIVALKKAVDDCGFSFFECSAVSHSGVKDIINKCIELLSTIPVPEPIEADYIPPDPVIDTSETLEIDRDEDCWYIEGKWLQDLVSRINFGDYESRMYFDRTLREAGIFEKLEELGIRDGDTVSIYDIMFEYID